MNKKMADIDTDPFGEHESRPEEPTDENIPLTPVGGGSTWEPPHEQETSFGSRSTGRQSQRNRVLINWVEGLYERLSQKLPRTSEVFHYNLFELRNSKLYFRDKSTPLTTKKGGLKLAKEKMKILGKEGLRDLDFNVPKGKVTARQATMLNEVEEEIPSASDVDKAGDIELQEIAKSTEDSIFKIKDVQTDKDDLFKHPLHNLLGLDKQLRSIRGLLKVEVAKRFSRKSALLKSITSSRNSENILENTMMRVHIPILGVVRVGGQGWR